MFVTICTRARRPILARHDAAATVLAAWRDAIAWAVGRYVIMPDHLHFFCAPSDERVGLTRWVQYWKAMTSRAWPRQSERPIWQRDFWDTRLRHGDNYEAKWEYVRSNPVRHGLVASADQWPYQGELTALWWDD